ncbi:MAG: selenocysteine-specific translation elongation factor [Fimbriimonadaceae bacterium]
MAKLIGTAGHVDHGKTTLIRALTGIDADRLPEEKRRGMTIDVGFAFLDFPEIGRVSIVDVPGHEKFIHNMLVGAHAIDVALLCVGADEAVMPQTREHFEILRLLPVDQMVVAMTRADLADEDTRSLVQLDIEELLEGTRFKGAPIVTVSALSGEGLDTLKDQLLAALKRTAASEDGAWYLPIDRVFGVKGHGCVVTGTLSQGQVKVGDHAIIEPGHIEVRVRALHSHDNSLQTSERGKRTAINLGGIKLEDVHRGMVVGEPGAVFDTQILDAKIDWLSLPKHGARIRMSIGAEEVIGKVFHSEANSEVSQFRLENRVAAALRQPIIIRQYSPMKLLGGGRVVVPVARVRRRSDAIQIVEQETDSDGILRVLSGIAKGVPTEEICRALGKAPQALGTTFETLQRTGEIQGFAGLWFDVGSLQAGVALFLDSLLKIHEQNPTVGLVPREKVVEQAGLGWAAKPLDRLMAWLAQNQRLVVQGSLVRHPKFSVQLTPKQKEFLDRVVAALQAHPINVPAVHEIATSVPAPIQAVEQIVRLGIESQTLVRVGDGLYYTASQLQELIGELRTKFGARPFTAADFRDLFGTSRKYAIPLLEYFDSQRVTLRQGDNRVLV